MDDLLQRLRQDMVELSLQGDSFTHQIWLMYGQFEQVVDRFGDAEYRPDYQPPAAVVPVVPVEVQCAKMAPMHRSYGHQPTVTVDPFTSDDECDDSDGPMTDAVRYRSGPRMNPLLETISTIEDDSGDESGPPHRLDATPVDLDKDSIGYAGSNSIDSGYKSSCPTPDYSSDGYYHHAGVKSAHQSQQQHQLQQQQQQQQHQQKQPPLLKPRRLVPTSPVNHVATTPDASSGPLAGSEPISAPGLDLAHLTSLRQTLLKAIERYESRIQTPTGLPRDRLVQPEPRRARSRSPGVSTWSAGPPLGPRPRSSSVSSRYQHQEGTGVSEPVVRPGSPIVSEGGQSTRHLSRSYRLGKEASHERLRALAAARPRLDLPNVVMATSTPLVVPRSSAVATVTPSSRVAMATPQHSGAIRVSDLPMREDEIDTLLYGRSTAANQKTGVSHASQSADLSPDKASVTADVEANGGMRFSRVARCMLDIIEDLQRQQQQQQQQPQQPQQPVKRVPCVPPKPVRQTAAAAAAPAAPPRASRNQRKKMPTPQPVAVEDDALSGADYHLYEEIVYDLGTKSNRCHDVPPPLPARPWQRRTQQPTKPVKPARWDVPVKLTVTPQPGRPNALANLYTLASQQQQQQLKQQQLKQQQLKQQKLQQQLLQQLKTTKRAALVQCSHDDEYGFRAVSHMV